MWGYWRQAIKLSRRFSLKKQPVEEDYTCQGK